MTGGNAPIKVFILAGQSNMEGQGVVSMDHPTYYNGGKGNLVWSMKNSASAETMRHLKNDKGEWIINLECFSEESSTNPTYLKYTVFKNYGLPKETKEVHIIKLFQYQQKVTLDKFMYKK